jgi:hypothetical protein
MRDTYCWIHETHETPGYLRCGECGHWYATPEELVEDFGRKMVEVDILDPPTDPAEVTFCAHCAHDF